MPIPTSIAQLYEAGDAWLADCSAHPDLVRLAWEEDILAPIVTGRDWLAVEARLVHTVYAIDRIGAQGRGPVVADPMADKAWWLAPVGAADELAEIQQLTVQPSGWTLRCPPTGWQMEGRFWLSCPDGSGQLTDPAILAAAFRQGGYRRPTEVRR